MTMLTKKSLTLFLLGLMLSLSAFAKVTGRNDAQIQQALNKYLQSKSQYRGVQGSTEDGIVTLEGTVNMYIDCVNLEKKVKRINNVDAVRNQVEI